MTSFKDLERRIRRLEKASPQKVVVITGRTEEEFEAREAELEALGQIPRNALIINIWKGLGAGNKEGAAPEVANEHHHLRDDEAPLWRQ